jgi:hypothetical protein
MDVNEITRAELTQTQLSWYHALTSGPQAGLDDIYALASSFNNGLPCRRGYDELGAYVRKGGYNMSFWVQFDDETKWVVRFPMIGAIVGELVDEKVKTEVATMMFLSEKTTIPTPQLIGYGLTGNSRHRLGLPFLILTHVPGKPLAVVWKELKTKSKEKIYDQLVDLVLQLRSHPFDRIGSLTLDDSGHWILANRPLTKSLAALSRDGIPIQLKQSYTTVTDYFADYFTHHRRRFIEQPNGAFDLEDAREKYAGLSLFESIIPQYVRFNEGPFLLTHGDLHQPNLIVDDNFQILAVLDWEWSCVLPIQVACLPPTCLSPHKLDEIALGDGRDEFVTAAHIFLDCLERKERSLPPDKRLCSTLKGMMCDGGYWFGLAIQDIYTFEYLFWENLFPAYFVISEEEAIETVFKNNPASENIIQQKLRENDEYQRQLQSFKVLPRGRC